MKILFASIKDWVLLVFGILLISCARAGEQHVLSAKKIGAWPPFGAFHSAPIVTDGNAAFVPTEEGLNIVDISDPTNPRRLSTIPGYIKSVAVHGDFAYLADVYQGLRIYNVSNRENPAAAKDIPAAPAERVVVSGDVALFATQFDLRVFNVADATAPISLGLVTGLSYVSDLKVAGGFAYVASLGAGLRVVDFTNPAGPTVVGFLSDSQVGSVSSIAIAGDYLYATAPAGILIISIANPSKPALLGVVDDPYQYRSLCVIGGLLYAPRVSQEFGFRIFDLGNPTAPARVYESEFSGAWIGFDDKYAYVTDSTAQLRILDITAPASPKLVADFSGITSDVILDPPYAFIADGGGGLRILDTSSSSSPRQIGSLAGGIQKIALTGSNVFAAFSEGTTSGLRVIDVTDRSQPREVASINTPFRPLNVVADGNLVYLINPTEPLQIVDVSDPGNPKLSGAYGLNVRSVAAAGGTIYAAYDWNEIHVIDVSDPSHPTKLNSLNSTSTVSALTLTGNLLLCGIAGWHGLEIFNVSDRTNLQRAAYYSINSGYQTAGAQHISVKDEFAFVSFGNDGLDIINISDPSQPWSAGRYNSGPAPIGGFGALQRSSIDGDFVCFAYDKRRVEIASLDALIAEQPEEIRTVYMPELSGSMAFSGKPIVYVSVLGGFGVLDVTDPETPKLISKTQSFDLAAASTNFLCALQRTPTNGIAVFGLEDPRNPRLLGSFYHPIENYTDRIRAIKIVDHYALVAVSTDLMIFDLGDGSNAKLLSIYSAETTIGTIATFGGIVCVGTGLGLEIVDWSDATAPTQVSKLTATGGYSVACMSPGKAYCYGPDSRLSIVDVSQPRTPTAIEGMIYPMPYTLWGSISAPTYVGGRLYMSAGGLQVFDVSEGQAPWVGGIWDVDSVGGLAIYRNYAYIANSSGRLHIYRLTSMPRLEFIKDQENWRIRWPERFRQYKLYQAPGPEGPWQIDASPTGTLDGFTSRAVGTDSEAHFFQLWTDY